MQDITQHFRDVFVRHAGKTAVIDHLRRREYTYRELEDISSRLARHLQPHVTPGGQVALLYANEMEMVLAYLACMQLGVTSIPINPEFHIDEIAHFLTFSKPELLLTCNRYSAKIPPSFSGNVIRLGAHADDALSIDALAKAPRLENGSFPHIHNELLAHIMFTSGSTGVPKAIPLRFGRMIGQLPSLAHAHARDENSRFYDVLPLAYIGGWHQLLLYLVAGGSVVLDQPFSAGSMYRFWSTIMEHNANCLWLTPSMVAALLQIGLEEEGQAEQIGKQIRWAIVAMAPLADDMKKRFEAMFRIRLQKAYGITETLVCTSWGDRVDVPDASVGRPMSGMEVIIAASDGSALPTGVEGEIRVRGSWIFEGYWHQDDLTAAAFDAQGYFRTGDLGTLDAQGHVFITGRIKDMIKRGGLNIAPAEIEAVLHRMPGIKDAAVVGIADAMYGEKIIAVVTLAAGSTLSADDILQFCREHLTALKVPVALHKVEVMPLNTAGKIDKLAVRAIVTKLFSS